MKTHLFFLGACFLPSAFCAEGLAGVVRDQSTTVIEAAEVTIFDAAGKGYRTSTSAAGFAFTGVPDGDYFFKVEKAGRKPVFGAVHLGGRPPVQLKVMMAEADAQKPDAVGAITPLRDAVHPPRSASKPPKVKPARVLKKVAPGFPEPEKNAGIHGVVRISMIILPDGSLDDLVVLSAPTRNLALAALAAVRQWRYSPTYLDGDAVETSLIVDVNFEP